MREYQFSQMCYPRGDLRAADALAFVKLMQRSFQREGWVDAEDAPVELTVEAMERAMRADLPESELARFGTTWVTKSAGDAPPIVLSIKTGGTKWVPSWFNSDFSRTQELPDLSYFRESIELIRPFEAVILDLANEDELRTRGVVKPRIEPLGSGVTSLRWFHYLDSSLARKIGGLSRCLEAPVFRVEQFCEGVLFQLTRDPFDAQNETHRLVQRRAMKYIGLGEWPPEANGTGLSITQTDKTG